MLTKKLLTGTLNLNTNKQILANACLGSDHLIFMEDGWVCRKMFSDFFFSFVTQSCLFICKYKAYNRIYLVLDIFSGKIQSWIFFLQ